MNPPRPLFLLGIGLLSVIPFARADQLDDMIAALRVGAKFDSDKLGTNLTAAINAMPGSPGKAFDEAEVNLYLNEVKLSIVDPPNQGGWPYRSFLIEDDLDLRKILAQGLADRFAAAPDPILAYALICPALYARDEKQVASLEAYLKDKDPFLYKFEQGEMTQFWRPNIESTLKGQAGGK